MIYNGNLDVVCGVPLEEATLQTLDWDGLPEYRSAQKQIWKVSPNDTEVAGYVRHVRNLYQVVIRNAGHMTTIDQPRSTYDLLNRLVFHQGF